MILFQILSLRFEHIFNDSALIALQIKCKYKLNTCKVSNNETVVRTKPSHSFSLIAVRWNRFPHMRRKAVYALTDLDALFKYSTEMFFCCEETLSFLDSTRHSQTDLKALFFGHPQAICLFPEEYSRSVFSEVNGVKHSCSIYKWLKGVRTKIYK